MAHVPDRLEVKLSQDEEGFLHDVYNRFVAAKVEFAGRDGFDPEEALRKAIEAEQHRLATPMDLTGSGPWRGGITHDGHFIACVALTKEELHQHRSTTYQHVMYVQGGDAFAFSFPPDGKPYLEPLEGGELMRNDPDSPHAFVPIKSPDSKEDWKIRFIAITARNLRDDTQEVSAPVRAAYKNAVAMLIAG